MNFLIFLVVIIRDRRPVLKQKGNTVLCHFIHVYCFTAHKMINENKKKRNENSLNNYEIRQKLQNCHKSWSKYLRSIEKISL